MPLSKINRPGLNTGIADSSDATAITIDSSERVGIGTTSPSFNFHATTSTGSEFAGFFQNTAGSGNGTSLVAKGGANNASPNFQVQDFNGNADFTVLGNGNVGINTNAAASLLEIKASALNRANGIALRGSGANDILYMYPSADNVATIEHLIDGSTSTGGPIHINPQGGDLILGTTSTIGPAQFNVDGGSQAGIGIRAGNGTSGYFNQVVFANNGNTALIGSIQRVNNASIQYNTTSDARLKENIADMTGAITRVKELAPKRYSWVNEDLDAADQDGFLAHEAQTVVPIAVSGTQDEVDGDGNPVYMQMDYSKLVPLLTGALQEAIAKIEVLEARVTALEGA